MKNLFLFMSVMFIFTGCSFSMQDTYISIKDKYKSWFSSNNKSNEKISVMDNNISYDELIPFDTTYLIVVKNDKQGLINKNRQIVLKPKYEKIYLPYNGFIKVKQNEKYGLINHKTLVNELEPIYDWINEHEHNLFIVQYKGLYGCIQDNFVYKIEPTYDLIYAFYEGMARVRKENKYGFINKQCEVVVEPKYEFVSNYLGGFAKVKLKNKLSHVDLKGKEVNKTLFYELEN